MLKKFVKTHLPAKQKQESGPKRSDQDELSEEDVIATPSSAF